VLQLSRNYSRNGELYKPDVQDAKVLYCEGEHFHVYYRFYRHAIISLVYNAEFDVDSRLSKLGFRFVKEKRPSIW
jgi:hypothetical protein